MLGLLSWILLSLIGGLLLVLLLGLEELVQLLIELGITDTTIDHSGRGGDIVYLLLGICVDLLHILCRGQLVLLNLDLLLLLVDLHFQLFLLLLKKLQVGIDLRFCLLLIELLVATNKRCLSIGRRSWYGLLHRCLLLLLHAASSSCWSHCIVILSDALIQVLLLLECDRLVGQVGLLISILSLLLSSIILRVDCVIGCGSTYNLIVGAACQVHLIV